MVAPVIPFFVATVVVLLKLPGNAIYAGADNGFANISPARHIFDAVWYSWSWFASGVSGGVGSVNLYNMLVTPYYVPFAFLQLAHPSPTVTSHVLEILKYGAMGLGPYLLAATVLGTSTRRDILTSLCIALFAMFNVLSALWLLQPASQFQLTFGLWPCIVAWEIRLLRDRRSTWEIVAFIALMYYALSFNPAHTICGWILLVAVALGWVRATGQAREAIRVGLLTATSLVLFTMPFWLSIVVYHAVGGSPLVSSSNLAAAGALIDHVRTSNSLSSFAGLFRLNTIVWWPTVDRSKDFDNPVMILANLSLAALAIAGLLNRGFDASTRRFWGAVWLLALFASKGLHAPLGDYYAWFLALPGADMFRESNDKFMLIAYIATIVLAAIGLRAVSRTSTRVVVAAALVVSAFPFLFQQPYLEQFFVRLPADYARVSALLETEPDARVLSFAPSDLNDQGSAFWFHGGNLDTTYFRNPVTYATALQALEFSKAPLYDDDGLVSAQEFFADRQLGRILGMRYVLVHKDFTNSLDVGYERSDLRVNGFSISHALMLQCEKDPDLEKVYDGAYLALFRVRTIDSPLAAVARLHAVSGYGNTLFPLLEMEPGNRGFAFSGAQAGDISAIPAPSYADAVEAIVAAPSRLTTDQVLSSKSLERSTAAAFEGLRLPHTSVGGMPPGDIQSGTRASEALALSFPSPGIVGADLAAFYRHTPGYSEFETSDLRFVRGGILPSSPGAVGLTRDVRDLVRSGRALSTSVLANVPLTSGLQMYVSLVGTQRAIAEPTVFELSMDGPGGPATLWILAAFSQLGTEEQSAPNFGALSDLEHLTPFSDEPAVGSVNLNVNAIVNAAIQSESDRELLYRPGLKVVRATLFLVPRAEEKLASTPTATIRMYDSLGSDFDAQNSVDIVTAPAALSLSLPPSPAPDGPPPVASKYRVGLASGAPGALALSAESLSNGEVAAARYDLVRWTPNQLVLRTVAGGSQAGEFHVKIDYRYRGREFSISAPIADRPADVPFGGAPLALGKLQTDPDDTSNWRQLNIDLRALLPDLARVVVRRVTISETLKDVSPGPSWCLFGALEGIRNDAAGYPLTALTVAGKTASLKSVSRLGYDARVAFGRLPATASYPIVVASERLQANVPSSVELGPRLASNPPIANGTLIDPTVGTITLGSAGTIELATMYNKAWAVRRGAFKAPAGLLPALSAWLATTPDTAPHFVTEGFANAWSVPAGSYTLIFIPQIARDVALLAVGPILAIWLLGALLLRATRRSRVSQT